MLEFLRLGQKMGDWRRSLAIGAHIPWKKLTTARSKLEGFFGGYFNMLRGVQVAVEKRMYLFFSGASGARRPSSYGRGLPSLFLPGEKPSLPLLQASKAPPDYTWSYSSKTCRCLVRKY